MKKKNIKMLLILLITTGSASFYTDMLAMSSKQTEEERFGMRIPPDQRENPKPKSYLQQKWQSFKSTFSTKKPAPSKPSAPGAQSSSKVIVKKKLPDIDNFFAKNIAPPVNKAIGAVNKELHAALYKFSNLLGKPAPDIQEQTSYRKLIEKFNTNIDTLFKDIKTRYTQST